MARMTYKELMEHWDALDARNYEGYGSPPKRQEPSRCAQKEAYIAGLGTIFYCEHPDFKSSLEAIMKECDEVISLRDLAYARIKREREKAFTILNGSFVREGSLLIPKKENRRILLRKSLVMNDPGDYGCYEVAIDQCYLPEDFNVDAYLEQIGKDNYLILKNTSNAPANRLGEDERAVWLYQDQAKDYGLFLESMAEMRLIYGSYKKVTPELIIDMTFASDELIDKQPRPYAHQLSLSGLSFGGHNSLSYISGDSMGAGVSYRIRGLRRETADGGTQKK